MLSTNLPVGTRYVRMLSDSPAEQVSEGVGFYVGNTPEPASAMLGFSALATLAVLRARPSSIRRMMDSKRSGGSMACDA
jgi:hypothetical protein